MLKRRWSKFKMKRAKIDKSDSSWIVDSKDRSNVATVTDKRTFHQFLMLSDDLQITILSFVADAPYETHDLKSKPMLTDVIPLVSKHFASLLENTDLFWREGLIRNLKTERMVWEQGLLRLLKKHERDSRDTTTEVGVKLLSPFPPDKKKDDISCEDQNYVEKIVNRACDYLSNKDGNATAAKSVYRSILDDYIQFTAPVFYMQSYPQIGEEFGLHFFEPRYRALIASVMKDRPDCRNGEPITADENGNFPGFIYANHNRVEPGKIAMIVHVRQCHIYSDGRADVILVPVAYVRLQKVWKQSRAGHLYMAKSFRLGEEGTRQIENTVRQTSTQEFVLGSRSSGNLRGGLASLFQFLIASGHFEAPEVQAENTGE